LVIDPTASQNRHRGIPAQITSNYRRLQRFLQFVRLDGAWLVRTLVGLLNLRAPLNLCLDRTNWKIGAKDINLLVLCIAARRVRIPILWSVLDAGSSNTADREALMKRYMRVFGTGSIGILLADREFIGNHWFEFLINSDIPFAIRVKENLVAVLDDGRAALFPGEAEEYTPPTGQPQGHFAGMGAAYAKGIRSAIACGRWKGATRLLA
jgi:hypothetical protein